MYIHLRWFSITILSVFIVPLFAFAADTPNWPDITFSFDGSIVQEGGSYSFPIGGNHTGTYTWPATKRAYGEIYKGTLNNAVLLNSHFLGNSGGPHNEADSFPQNGDYFVVIRELGDDDQKVTEWLQRGTSVDPNAYSPGVWGLIQFHVGLSNTPPEISSLQQFKFFSEDVIPEGETFIGNSLALRADVVDTENDQVQLEVEVKPVGQPFDETQTVFSDPTAPGELLVDVNELIPPPEQTPVEGYQAAFHWRARAVDNGGLTSAWQEFGAPDNTDFVAHYTLGFAASELAKELLEQAQLIDPSDAYELGARGWLYEQDRFATPEEITSGYTYRSGLTKKVVTGPGIDCSGLVYWSFNKSTDPYTADGNYVANVTADGMHQDKQSDPIAESELQPGDGLFFDNYTYIPETKTWIDGADGIMDHVASYVGESGGYDVVSPESELTGITGRSKEIYALAAFGFDGYRRIHQHGFEGLLEAGSPVDLIVTDPEGNTLSYDDIIASNEEAIREIPGKLYYSEIQQGHDGNPKDVVYIPKLSEGTYRVKVISNSDATPDETYSLRLTVNGSTTVLAENAPINTIPQNGYGIVVSSDGSISIDTTPPEAHFSFNASTKEIDVLGTDNLSVPTVVQSATSTVITDDAANTLVFDVARDVTQSRFVALVMPSFAYSTGTSTNATTSLRYFWATDRKGEYTFLISAIKTPSERLIAIYSKRTNKTYVVAATPEDDDADLSLKTVLLLLRKKLQTYPGLVIPSVSTNQGIIRVEI